MKKYRKQDFTKIYNLTPSEYYRKRAFEFTLIVKVFQVGRFGQTHQLIVFFPGFLRSAEFKRIQTNSNEFKRIQNSSGNSKTQ